MPLFFRLILNKLTHLCLLLFLLLLLLLKIFLLETSSLPPSHPVVVVIVVVYSSLDCFWRLTLDRTLGPHSPLLLSSTFSVAAAVLIN